MIKDHFSSLVLGEDENLSLLGSFLTICFLEQACFFNIFEKTQAQKNSRFEKTQGNLSSKLNETVVMVVT